MAPYPCLLPLCFPTTPSQPKPVWQDLPSALQPILANRRLWVHPALPSSSSHVRRIRTMWIQGYKCKNWRWGEEIRTVSWLAFAAVCLHQVALLKQNISLICSFIHSINIIEHVVLFQAHLGIQQRTRCPQAVYSLMAEIENKHINIECNWR